MTKRNQGVEGSICRDPRSSFRRADFRFPFSVMDPALLDQQARITAVRIDGAKSTRRSFLASLIYPHLPQPDSLSTFESVLRATRDIGHYLVQTDLFQSVHARLESSAEPSAKPGDVDVIFSARERPRFFLKTSTEVGNSEGNAVRNPHIYTP
jgi:outer membrane protein insertion porin family